VTLVRLQVLSTVLLTAAVAGPRRRSGPLREVSDLPHRRTAGTGRDCRTPVLAWKQPVRRVRVRTRWSPPVAKTRLPAHLDGDDAELVRADTAAGMSITRQIVTPAPG
jgi:hypothetical protein